jgi:hypothetical protein
MLGMLLGSAAATLLELDPPNVHPGRVDAVAGTLDVADLPDERGPGPAVVTGHHEALALVILRDLTAILGVLKGREF